MTHADDPGLTSVGQIEGLGPRQVPAGDVALLDELDPLTWRVVAAWLQGRPSAARRRTCLRVLASWLRWLYASEPALEPLAASGSHLDAYCYAALTTGAGTSGKPLAKATVAGRRATLASFYAFAGQSGAMRRRSPNGTPPLTRTERRLLRGGVARLAEDGRPAEALAVALLEATGASVDSLAALTVHDVHALPGGDHPLVLVLRGERDGPVAFPVPPRVRPLLRAQCDGRTPGEPLITGHDGRDVDVEWLTSALTGAALAAGLPRHRAELLRPDLLRAGTVTGFARSHGP
ncbi:hypothetical protein [Nonomuraea sp. SBT364]|uniref:hypothetical protein n=1 Tax=Nonomuraea sp. SBT364 TaxID=1580530 RepID=UPI00066C6F83|nr:hypothetical protein [Nonomuraea sp. SBT364]